jgi:hypothetical protein
MGAPASHLSRSGALATTASRGRVHISLGIISISTASLSPYTVVNASR